MTKVVDSKIPLTLLAGCKWWEVKVAECPAITSGSPSLEMGMDVYEETLTEFESLMKKDSEQQWMRKVASTGTHSDQVAALLTLIQMSPVMSIPHLRQLLLLAQVKANRIIQPVMNALKRMMVEELLPSRKLVYFADQSWMQPAARKGSAAAVTKGTVLLGYFEDFLKKTMATFVQLMYDCQSSPIEAIRTSCVDLSFDLLACIKGANVSGEQEPALLKLLVKALGDKAERRVSSKAALLVRRLAVKRPCLKEALIDQVREQHLSAFGSDEYNRGLNLGCSLLSVFPLNPQDDAFVANKLVQILSEIVNQIITKKQVRDKKRKLENTCGLTDGDAKILRLCLRAMETALVAAGSDCPVPETTNSLLIRLSHETHIPGLSVAILNFLNKLSQALKTDSPKLVRAIYGQAAGLSVYVSNSLPWLLSLVKDSVFEDDLVSESTKIAFKRRLLQLACCVSEPGVVPVILAMTEPVKLQAELSAQKDLFGDDDDNVALGGKSAKSKVYNAEFWDPVSAAADTESQLYERHLLRFHFDETVRTAADAADVSVPDEARPLSAMLVEVSKMQLEEEKKKRRVAPVDIEDVEIDLPGCN